MGRRCVLSGENLTLSTGNVLAAIRPAAADAAASILAIERITISQSGSTTSAMIRSEIGSRDTAGTLTMTSQTPNPVIVGGPASGIAGSTAPAGTAAKSGVNSSADSGGTYTPIHQPSFNNLAGLDILFPPEQRLIIPPGKVFIVRLLATPGTTTGWNIQVWFDEYE